MSAERDGDAAAFQLRGQTFRLPTLAWGLNDDDPGQRLVAGFATGDAVRHGRDCVLLDSLEPGAVDLGLVRAGRAPLLVVALAAGATAALLRAAGA